MSEEKKDKKKNAEYDEDVAEMADVYAQLVKCLEEAEVSVMPTGEALEAMAVSICIGRQKAREREDYLKRQEGSQKGQSATSNWSNQTPTNTSATAQGKDEKECPTCHKILIRRFKPGGSKRGYFSCGTCRQYVNEDGSVKAWPPRN